MRAKDQTKWLHTTHNLIVTLNMCPFPKLPKDNDCILPSFSVIPTLTWKIFFKYDLWCVCCILKFKHVISLEFPSARLDITGFPPNTDFRKFFLFALKIFYYFSVLPRSFPSFYSLCHHLPAKLWFPCPLA